VEYELVSRSAGSADLQGARPIYVRKANQPNLPGWSRRYEEFGSLSSWHICAPLSMVWLILHARNSPYGSLPIELLAADAAVSGRLIDLGKAIFGSR
jgi:hypothetical protein